MTGNVWEIIETFYADNFNVAGKSTVKVIKGGGFSSYARTYNVSERWYLGIDWAYENYGFRLAL